MAASNWLSLCSSILRSACSWLSLGVVDMLALGSVWVKLSMKWGLEPAAVRYVSAAPMSRCSSQTYIVSKRLLACRQSSIVQSRLVQPSQHCNHCFET